MVDETAEVFRKLNVTCLVEKKGRSFGYGADTEKGMSWPWFSYLYLILNMRCLTPVIDCLGVTVW